MRLVCCVVLVLALATAIPAFSAETTPPANPLKVGGVLYLGYQYGETQTTEYNQFFVRRAYLTVQKQVLPFLSARITMNTSQDLEGDGRGDMEMHLKYAHGVFTFPDVGPLTHQSLEAGIVHAPWLDFEEKIIRYRMRDKMFIERSGIVNSADFGVTYAAHLGETLPKDYRDKVNSKYAGRYGSFALGIYNGGGYHAVEENTDNVFEARLSLRPLADVAPGVQLSGFAVIGKGNSPDGVDPIPDWNAYLAMISWEHPRFTFALQYLTGDGNQKGSWVRPDGDHKSLEYEGTSFFAEWKVDHHWRLIGGWDRFDVDRAILKNEYVEYFTGVGYDFGKSNLLVFDYNRREFEATSLDPEFWYQLTLQLKY